MNRIEEALKLADETRALVIGQGVIKNFPALFKEQFPGKKAVVIADATTFEIAGKTVCDELKNAGIQQEEPFIFTTPDLYAEYSFVDQLAAFLNTNDAIPVAVGAGTINDLTKLSSHLAGRRYLCVATAASMDGYTAFGASITAQGAKQTFSCPAPQACLADIDIVAHAPQKMTASGYADLFAKVTAGADWILADGLDVEPIDENAWKIVQDGLPNALGNPRGISEKNTDSISALIEGLMLGGFAMQWSKSSRPASGAEHQFSHLWNMENHLNNGEHISHGFQVSVGMLAITALFGEVIKTPFDQLDVEACCKAWPSWDELEKEVRLEFAGTDFLDVVLTETKSKYVNAEELGVQLRKLKENWFEIRNRLSEQIIPYEKVKASLQLVGAPVNPEEIGLSRARLKQTFIRAQFIRRRFTVLDLAVRTGNLDKWLDALFGRGGIFEI